MKSVPGSIPNNLTPQERSSYFRGLLLIMAADGRLDKNEISVIKEIGAQMDFETSFVDESIQNVLQNEFVSKRPPVFQDVGNAQHFLQSAIKIALADGTLDAVELKWLEEATYANRLSSKWLRDEIEKERRLRGLPP